MITGSKSKIMILALLIACVMIAGILSSCTWGFRVPDANSTEKPGVASADNGISTLLPNTPVATNRPTAAPTAAAPTAAAPTAAAPTAAEPTAVQPTAYPDNYIDFTSLKTTAAALTNADFRLGLQRPRQHIQMLVILVSFTDGHTIGKDEFENLFTMDHDINNCIKSVSSYYKYNSYGTISFDYQFVYYDSGLSCREAWLLVNEEDERGNFYGNRYIYDIFNDIKAHSSKYGIDDFQKLDGDGDGFVDIATFVFSEDTKKTNPGEPGIYGVYGSAMGTTSLNEYMPDTASPAMKLFLKTGLEVVFTSPETRVNRSSSGIRVILHEIAHTFGVSDYYDFYSYEGTFISAFGGFDLQEEDVGDWNTYSKFGAGILKPYVVDGLEDSITIKIGCSSEKNQAVLIPTSAGWNGTPFDEFILIDVVAPVGANGFDWIVANDEREPVGKPDGGVRVLHVDGRLEKNKAFLDPYTAKQLYDAGEISWISYAFYCTNGIDPSIPGQSRYYHLVEIVPSDGSSCYRICTPPELNYAILHLFNTADLFGPGDVFSMETCRDAFASYPLMNNGSRLDYSVKVEHYDTVNHEAIITITRVK